MLIGGGQLGNISFDVKPIILFVVLLVGLYGGGRYVKASLGVLRSVLLKLTMGVMAILVINVVAEYTNFLIPLNYLTVPIVGFLGIPGVVLLVVIKQIL